MAFQQRVLEAASGASPYCYGTLKLAFGNTIDAIKLQKTEDERKAREEAAKHGKLMSRPMLVCRTTHGMRKKIGGRVSYERPGCGEMSIRGVENACTCGRSLVCSKCGQTWDGGNVCVSCSQTFR